MAESIVKRRETFTERKGITFSNGAAMVAQKEGYHLSNVYATNRPTTEREGYTIKFFFQDTSGTYHLLNAVSNLNSSLIAILVWVRDD